MLSSYGSTDVRKEDGFLYIFLPIAPQPAVRSTLKGGHQPRAVRYHKYKRSLQMLWESSAQIRNMKLPQVFDFIEFGLPIADPEAKYLSKARKAKRINSISKPHRKRPDIDNLFKGFTDTIYYKKKVDDGQMHMVTMRKVYAPYKKGYIFVVLKQDDEFRKDKKVRQESVSDSTEVEAGQVKDLLPPLLPAHQTQVLTC
jgi:Holliday junction resolvase RusA-like endonuclease